MERGGARRAGLRAREAAPREGKGVYLRFPDGERSGALRAVLSRAAQSGGVSDVHAKQEGGSLSTVE